MTNYLSKIEKTDIIMYNFMKSKNLFAEKNNNNNRELLLIYPIVLWRYITLRE